MCTYNMHIILYNYTLLSSTIRECNQECDINGVHFDEEVSALISIAYLHYDPQLWMDPQVFNPERLASRMHKI